MIEMMLAAQVAAMPAKTEEKCVMDTMFEGAEAFGKIRAGWIDHRGKGGNPDTTATALGGQFGIDTASYKGMKLHLAAYTGYNLNGLSPETESSKYNGEYTGEKDSFIYIAEANIAYANERLQFMAGRILIDTPYADSDDLRMAPNTFEGALLSVAATEEMSVAVAYLNRWAGFDTAGDTPQHTFKPLVSSDSYGALAASLSMAFSESAELALWYYDIDNLGGIAYAEYAGEVPLNDALTLSYALQGAAMSQRSDSGMEGGVYGAGVSADYAAFSFGLAYNAASVDSGNAITDGFGGGPYLTSMDEMTIGVASEMAPGENVSALLVGAGYAFEQGMFEGMGVEVAHARFASADDTVKIREDDLIVTYEAGDHWAVEGIYARYDDENSAADRFDRAYIRVDYNF